MRRKVSLHNLLNYVSSSVFMLILLTGCQTEQNSDTGKEQPNILLILVDDMGFSDIACYGGEIATPNLDRLAENGLRVMGMHNTAKCFSSRACLLTGQYAHHVGMDNIAKFENGVSIAEVLRSQKGYRTLMTGKHHGRENPIYFGFDRYFGLKDGCSNHFNPGNQREGEPVPTHKRGGFTPRRWCIDSAEYRPYTPEEKDFYTTDYFTNYAIDYLEEYKDEDKPFFLYLAYTAPHDPLMAWPEDIEKYLGKYMEGYEAIRKRRFERQKEIGILDETYALSDPTYESWDSLSHSEKLVRDSIMATYAAMIDRVDQNIGRVVNKLEELDQLDNTLILFMSDNGAQAMTGEENWLTGKGKITDNSLPIGNMGRWTSQNFSWANVSNTPFRYYKDDSHEGGTATPFIAYWKGRIQNPGSIINYPCHLIDVLPTILEITGTEYPGEFNGERINPQDGISLYPLLKGESPERLEPIYWSYYRGKAIRAGKWKLVADFFQPWELYDFSVDKSETNDVIDQHPGVARKLEAYWENWINTKSWLPDTTNTTTIE